MTGNSSNWPIAVTGYDSLRLTIKQLDRQGRSAAPIGASDLLGPGMSSQAVHILDWNDEVATFNGFFYTSAGGLNSPEILDDEEEVLTLPWIGQSIARQDGTGTQQVWNTDDPGSMYFRVRNWAPNVLDPDAPPIFGEWQRFATRSGFIAEEDLHPDVRDSIDQALEDAEEALGLIVPPNYIFRQPDEPVSTEDRELLAYDMWFDTDDDNHFYVYFDGAWVEPDEEILSGAGASAAAAMAEAVAAAQAAAEAVEGAGNTIYDQDTEPTGGTYVIGDTWNDTNDGNKPYRWNGTDWVPRLVGWLETDATASRGIKVTTLGLTAYNGSGSPTFTIDGSTGSVAMVGDLAVGSTITGATITGTLQTTTTANRGVKITSTGAVFYDTGGSAVLSFSSTTGILQVTGPIVSGANISGSSITASSGGVIQSESTFNRGVKINSAGLVAYNSSGSPTFTITGSTGAVTMLGSLTSGSTITGASITASTLTSTSGSTSVTISGGQVRFGSSSYIYSAPPYDLYITGGAAALAFSSSGLDIGGVVNVTGSSGVISTRFDHSGTPPSSSGTANCYIDTGGLITKSTSSLRYKNPIRKADLGAAADAMLELDAEVYTRKDDESEQPHEYVGYYAERLHELGLTDWVDYDAEGRPDGVGYANLSIPLLALVQRQQGMIEDLRTRIETLEAA